MGGSTGGGGGQRRMDMSGNGNPLMGAKANALRQPKQATFGAPQQNPFGGPPAGGDTTLRTQGPESMPARQPQQMPQATTDQGMPGGEMGGPPPQTGNMVDASRFGQERAQQAQLQQQLRAGFGGPAMPEYTATPTGWMPAKIAQMGPLGTEAQSVVNNMQPEIEALGQAHAQAYDPNSSPGYAPDVFRQRQADAVTAAQGRLVGRIEDAQARDAAFKANNSRTGTQLYSGNTGRGLLRRRAR